MGGLVWETMGDDLGALKLYARHSAARWDDPLFCLQCDEECTDDLRLLCYGMDVWSLCTFSSTVPVRFYFIFVDFFSKRIAVIYTFGSATGAEPC